MDTPRKPEATIPNNAETAAAQPVKGPFAGRPLDGSQYIDVIEEQEYADRRPTPDEQKPRFSYLRNRSDQAGKK